MKNVNGQTDREHSPKTGALVAYESGALSPRGRARVEKHLATCAACRRELAAIQMYDASVDVIRDAQLPKVDWSRMELALEREARVQIKAQATASRRPWLVPAVGLALAAAAVIAIMLWPDAPEAPTASHDRTTDEVPAPPVVDTTTPEVLAALALSGHLTLVAGEGRVTVDGAETLAAEGVAIAQGAAISTQPDGTVHAVVASPTGDPQIGIVLASASGMHFQSLDSTEAALGLDAGRMSVRVRSTRTIVLAGDYRIEAEVAWFIVDLAEDGSVRVDVREGDVHVTGPSTDRVVTGPLGFSSAGGEVELESGDAVGMMAGYDQLPRLHVARPGIVRWEIGDLPVSGAGELAMRVGTGEISITGWDARGRELHTMATVGPDGLDLAPDDLQPVAPRIRVGTLPTAVIREVVSSHHSSLERCYERALRAQADLTARVELQITVDMTGEVSAVHLGGDEIPAAMAQCLTQDVDRWTFPAPDGGPMTFVLPMPFTPSGR